MSAIGYWNPARKPDMFEFSGKLECKEFFDDWHFTNSLNAPVTPGFKAKPDAHRMYVQDQVVIHTVRM
jgi:hypothetical protein